MIRETEEVQANQERFLDRALQVRQSHGLKTSFTEREETGGLVVYFIMILGFVCNGRFNRVGLGIMANTIKNL